jgi:hypothetical protein
MVGSSLGDRGCIIRIATGLSSYLPKLIYQPVPQRRSVLSEQGAASGRGTLRMFSSISGLSPSSPVRRYRTPAPVGKPRSLRRRRSSLRRNALPSLPG